MATLRSCGVRAPSLLSVLAAVLGLAALPLHLSAQTTSLARVMRDTVLANGLHVIVVPNPTIPLATIQVTIRNGAFTQAVEADEGMPHILEHMLFRSYAGGEGFAGEANKIDASYNGTTSDETVTYYITLPSANLERGVRLMADLMRQPRFREDDLNAEKQVIAGELERLAASPSYLLGATVDRLLWGSAWTQKNAIGNLNTIRGATAPRLKELYDRFYVPNNAALVITGDLTAENGFALASRHFERWRQGADPFSSFVPPAIPPLGGHRQVIVDLESNDITMLVRWAGPSVRDDADATYAAALLASIVNNPGSAFQERLVDSGLFQSVSMGYAALANTGPLSLHALTTPDRLADASAALHAELTRLAEPGYFTADEVQMAKKRVAVDWAMFMETPSGLASAVGELWSVAGLDYTRGYLDAIQAQDTADLERFIGRYLAARPRVTGLMVSPATRRANRESIQGALALWRN